MNNDSPDTEHKTQEGSSDDGANSQQSAATDLEQKCAEYLEGWKRARADYENVLKNQAQMREEDRRRLRIQLAEELLPVIDNFGYVTQHMPDVSSCDEAFQKKFATWSAGIGHIDRQFTESLKTLGVEPIAALGQKFDPNLHESGGARKTEGQGEGVIVEELIKGWKLGDIVLRPAKVIVNE